MDTQLQKGKSVTFGADPKNKLALGVQTSNLEMKNLNSTGPNLRRRNSKLKVQSTESQIPVHNDSVAPIKHSLTHSQKIDLDYQHSQIMELLTSRDGDEQERQISDIFAVDPDFSREVPADFYSQPKPKLEDSAPWNPGQFADPTKPPSNTFGDNEDQEHNSSHVPTIIHADAEEYKHSVFEDWSDDERMQYKIRLTKWKSSFKSKARQSFQNKIGKELTKTDPKKQRIEMIDQKRQRKFSKGKADPHEIISAWSQESAPYPQIAEKKEILSREKKIRAKIGRAGCRSADSNTLFGDSSSQQSRESRGTFLQRSKTPVNNEPKFDLYKLMNQSKNVQTANEYATWPEQVWNSIKSMSIQQIYEVLLPVYRRQEEQLVTNSGFVDQMEKLNVRQHHIEGKMKRSFNILKEFDHVRQQTKEMNEKFEDLTMKVTDDIKGCHAKMDKQAATQRNIQTDMKAQSKFIQQRNEDQVRLQGILDKFKDNMIEKLRSLTDNFIIDTRKMDIRYLEMQEMMARHDRQLKALDRDNSNCKLVQKAFEENVLNMRDDLGRYEQFFKYEPRIDRLENQAKSDLLAVTTKMQKHVELAKKSLNREQTFCMVYGVTNEMMRAVFDLKKHLSGKDGSYENPKRETQVQCMLNLLDWQREIVDDQHFTDNFQRLMKRLRKTEECYLMEPEILRRQKFEIELNQKKFGRKVTKCESQKRLIKPDLGLRKQKLLKDLQNARNYLVPKPFKDPQIETMKISPTLTAFQNALGGRGDVDLQKDQKQQSMTKMPGLLKKQLTYHDGDAELKKLYRRNSVPIKYKRPTIDNLFNERDAMGLKPRGRTVRKSFAGGLAQKLTMRKTATLKRQSMLPAINIDSRATAVQKRRVTKLLEIKEADDQQSVNPSAKNTRGSIIKQSSMMQSLASKFSNILLKTQQEMENQAKQRRLTEQAQIPRTSNLIGEEIQDGPLSNQSSQRLILGQNRASSNSQASSSNQISQNIDISIASPREDLPNCNNPNQNQDQNMTPNPIPADPIQSQNLSPNPEINPNTNPNPNSNPVLNLIRQFSSQQVATNQEQAQVPRNHSEIQQSSQNQLNLQQQQPSLTRESSLAVSNNILGQLLGVNNTSSANPVEQIAEINDDSAEFREQSVSYRQKKPSKKKVKRNKRNRVGEQKQTSGDEVRAQTRQSNHEQLDRCQQSKQEEGNGWPNIETSIKYDDSNDEYDMSEDYMSSETETESVNSALYDEFVTKQEYDEFTEYVENNYREDLREEFGVEFLEEAEDLCDKIVQDAIKGIEENILLTVEEQLKKLDTRLSDYCEKETRKAVKLVDQIQSVVLPKLTERVENMIKSAQNDQAQFLEDIDARFKKDMHSFNQRCDFFDTNLRATQIRFKRLGSDTTAFRQHIIKEMTRFEDLHKVMRTENLATSKVVSTLVELEFVQQSLDFQDEFDKTQMHLYGLNDLNMTVGEFVDQTNQIAQRKLKEELLQTRINNSRKNESSLQQRQQSITDRCENGDLTQKSHQKGGLASQPNEANTQTKTHYAIQMSQECIEKVADDPHLKKTLNQAFKLACVYYEPSDVLFRGNRYKRRALIEAKRQILDAEWQLMLKFQPWKRLFDEDRSVKGFYEQLSRKLHQFVKGDLIPQEHANQEFQEAFKNANLHEFKEPKKQQQESEEFVNDLDFYNSNLESRLFSSPSPSPSPSTDLPQSKGNLEIQGVNVAFSPELNNTQDNSHINHRVSRKNAPNQTSFGLNRLSPRGNLTGISTIESKTRSLMNAKNNNNNRHNESLFSSEDIGDTIQNLTGQQLQKNTTSNIIQSQKGQQIDKVHQLASLLQIPLQNNKSILSNHQPGLLSQRNHHNLNENSTLLVPSATQKLAQFNDNQSTTRLYAQNRNVHNRSQSQEKKQKVSKDYKTTQKQKGKIFESLIEMRSLIGAEKIKSRDKSVPKNLQVSTGTGTQAHYFQKKYGFSNTVSKKNLEPLESERNFEPIQPRLSAQSHHRRSQSQFGEFYPQTTTNFAPTKNDGGIWKNKDLNKSVNLIKSKINNQQNRVKISVSGIVSTSSNQNSRVDLDLPLIQLSKKSSQNFENGTILSKNRQKSRNILGKSADLNEVIDQYNQTNQQKVENTNNQVVGQRARVYKTSRALPKTASKPIQFLQGSQMLGEIPTFVKSQASLNHSHLTDEDAINQMQSKLVDRDSDIVTINSDERIDDQILDGTNANGGIIVVGKSQESQDRLVDKNEIQKQMKELKKAARQNQTIKNDQQSAKKNIDLM